MNFATGALGAAACNNRVNNTFSKLLECMTVAGVRSHQAALQAIADANGGVRAAGTPGYEQSVSYVVGKVTAAGYNINLSALDINSDAVAYSTLLFAMNTESVNGQRGKGNFSRPALKWLEDF